MFAHVFPTTRENSTECTSPQGKGQIVIVWPFVAGYCCNVRGVEGALAYLVAYIYLRLILTSTFIGDFGELECNGQLNGKRRHWPCS